ncbi:hypothetical protein QS257_00170 [Terrilactibacillus sp. S3-3]|nr:hypothetical protein QS257_00170 [Terrilactibacillus sp. S3-3]
MVYSNLQTTKAGKQSTVVSYTSNDLNSVESGFNDLDVSLLMNKVDLGSSRAKILSENSDTVQTNATLNGADQNVSIR